VRPETIERLQCPQCGGGWSRPEEGMLRCDGCGWEVPITGGVPRFVGVEEDRYVRSFGRQWNRYEVQHVDEDEATFQAKTGVTLSELQGRRVLDAGCGGGRYSFVAGSHGAHVVGVDLSSAVDKARRLCADLAHVDILQANLMDLPLKPGSFDLAFSIGVLHHTPDTRQATESVARMVRPGGRLSIWVYRRNTPLQEAINSTLRGITTRLSAPTLEGLSRAGAVLGAIPLVRSTLNKLVSFSNHPCPVNRVCDTFDWYSPAYQFHHTEQEVCGWFEQMGFKKIDVLPPERTSRFYRWCHRHNLFPGSGVNVTGIRYEPCP